MLPKHERAPFVILRLQIEHAIRPQAFRQVEKVRNPLQTHVAVNHVNDNVDLHRPVARQIVKRQLPRVRYGQAYFAGPLLRQLVRLIANVFRLLMVFVQLPQVVPNAGIIVIVCAEK